jgi:hypothetical protein
MRNTGGSIYLYAIRNEQPFADLKPAATNRVPATAHAALSSGRFNDSCQAFYSRRALPLTKQTTNKKKFKTRAVVQFQTTAIHLFYY